MFMIRKPKNRPLYLLVIGMVSALPLFVSAQNSNDSLLQQATLQSVVQYALTHQPQVQQALID